MTTLKQLYDLQELDLGTAECRDRIKAIERRVGDRSEIEELARRQEVLKASIGSLTVRQRSESLEAETLRAKIDAVEARLYSGNIKSVREMDGFQKEASFLREQLKVLDERVLESMVALDEAQRSIGELESTSVESEERWQAEQADLGRELEDRRANLLALEGRRDALAAPGERRPGHTALRAAAGIEEGLGGRQSGGGHVPGVRHGPAHPPASTGHERGGSRCCAIAAAGYCS